ncbi:MAG: DUF998 domain-containing protein [Thaumarchaeota archaeon]|nr:DUF998 domain-containing protein [Nitrososphaerota archaeon]
MSSSKPMGTTEDAGADEDTTRRRRLLRLSALCGISAPLVFTVILGLAGALQPGYNHFTQQISELGYTGAANPAIQNGNFILTGLLIFAFGVGLQGAFTGKGTPGRGPRFVIIAGLGFAGAGFFPGNYDSWTGAVHGILFFVAFISFILAPLLIARKLGSESYWSRLRPYCQATSIAVTVLFLSFLLLGSQEALSPWRGVFQRILVATPLLWVEVMAISLFRAVFRP